MSKTAEEFLHEIVKRSSHTDWYDVVNNSRASLTEIVPRAMNAYADQRVNEYKEKLKEEIKIKMKPEIVGGGKYYREPDFLFACEEILRLLSTT